MLDPNKIPTIYKFEDLKPKENSKKAAQKTNCMLFYTQKQMEEFLQKCRSKIK